MKIVYWYTSVGNAGGPTVRWDKTAPTQNSIALSIESEGFWFLWKTLLERKILDEVVIVIESARYPGVVKWKDNFTCYVVPHIIQSLPLLGPGDVLFARGGFRTWFTELQKMNEEKRWVLFYRAATHRLKWPFWDIVIEDLTDKHFVHGNRIHYRFNKPISPEFFSFDNNCERDFDVMLHASHIHDKKGQWKGVDAAIAYREKFGRDLKIVMPGGFYGGANTRAAFDKIKAYRLNVATPGMVQKTTLAKLMNRSKLYFHLGGAGQNDRGNLEAMLCGCRQVIGNPVFHPPFVWNNEEISAVVSDHSPMNVADKIDLMLKEWNPSVPPKVAAYYEKENGFEVTVSQMKILIDFLKRNPVPDREAAIKEFVSE